MQCSCIKAKNVYSYISSVTDGSLCKLGRLAPVSVCVRSQVVAQVGFLDGLREILDSASNTVRAEMIISIAKAGLGCLRSSRSKLVSLLMLDAQIIGRNTFLGVFDLAASTDTCISSDPTQSERTGRLVTPGRRLA